jgi:hypothetical protein
MIRSLLVLTLISTLFIRDSASAVNETSASQEPCAQDNNAWVTHALEKMDTIKPGMTRANLLAVFTTEGGLSTGVHRAFVSRDCQYFKVNVDFRAVGRPNRDKEGRVTLDEDTEISSSTYLDLTCNSVLWIEPWQVFGNLSALCPDFTVRRIDFVLFFCTK